MDDLDDCTSRVRGHLNAMDRLKRDEVLKQRISEETGMPIGDINAQNSRCFESKTLYFQDLLKEPNINIVQGVFFHWASP